MYTKDIKGSPKHDIYMKSGQCYGNKLAMAQVVAYIELMIRNAKKKK